MTLESNRKDIVNNYNLKEHDPSIHLKVTFRAKEVA